MVASKAATGVAPYGRRARGARRTVFGAAAALTLAISIPLDSLTYPLSRALYATHNTILQVVASIASFATIVVTALLLGPFVGIYSIPLGYAAGTALKVALLGIFLVARMRRLAWRPREDAVSEPGRPGSSERP